MFYLYIDEVLVSQSVNFNEIYDFIFDFYFDPLKAFFEMKNQEWFTHHYERFYEEIRNLVFTSLHGLILHHYDSFIYRDHEVKIYYGVER